MSDEMDRLKKELFGEPEVEGLCEELEKAKVQLNGKWALKHRLLLAEDYDETDNSWYNQELEKRRAWAERLKAEKDWWEYVYCHEKDFWPTVLEEIKELAPPSDWCYAVRSAWILSDILWMNRETWTRIFSERERLAGLINAKEAALLAAESDPLTVYRGCRPEHVDGLSWTLSFESAEHFKRKAGHKGVIFSGVVKQEHVIAFFDSNEEFEIVVAPENVAAKEIEE